MRTGYLFLSMLVMAGLSACQQESSPMIPAVQTEADAPAQQAVQPEADAQAEASIAGSIPETTKQTVKEAAEEVAATGKVKAERATPVSPAAPVAA